MEAPIAKVVSEFVSQYYDVLQGQPSCAFGFYGDDSTIICVDGENTQTVSDRQQIHNYIISMGFTGIVTKTFNFLGSWGGSILVVVSGSLLQSLFKDEFSGRRKFTQTFVLAPQESGYYVLNDIFQFLNEDVIDQSQTIVDYQHQTPVFLGNIVDYQHQAPILSENIVDYQHQAPILSENIVDYQHQSPILSENGVDYHQHQDRDDYQHPVPAYLESTVDSQITKSSPLSATPDVPDYVEEASEHFDSLHIEGDGPVDEQSLHDQQEQDELVVESGKETPLDESSSLLDEEDREQEPPPIVEKSNGEPPKLSYASMVRATTGKTAVPLLVAYLPKKTPSPEPVADDSNVEQKEVVSQEGESKSVFVNNLPSAVTTIDIEQEFSQFGKIKPDGVFIRRKDFGGSFAFVDFEDAESAEDAIQKSPILFDGRRVYIQKRKQSNINSSSNVTRVGRGGGRGRGSEAGRWSSGGRSFGGRGNYQNGSTESHKPRGNNGVRGSK